MPPSGSFWGRLDGCWYARAARGVQFRLQVIPSHREISQLPPWARGPTHAATTCSQRPVRRDGPGGTATGHGRMTAPQQRTPRQPTGRKRSVSGRERSVAVPESNLGFSESAHRMLNPVTERRVIHSPAASVTPLGRECRIRLRATQAPGCADAMTHVKNSPPSGAQTSTDRCHWGASCLVRGVVDWKRRAAACFDPSHRGGRSGHSETDVRRSRSRPSSVPRGGRSPLVRYPYEGKFHHELHPPGRDRRDR